MAGTRAEFGPTLPGALRDRFGIPPAATLAVAAAVALLAMSGIVYALDRPSVWGERVIRKGPPVFNMIYPGDAMHVAKSQAGELLRLEGRRKGLDVSVVVRPLSERSSAFLILEVACRSKASKASSRTMPQPLSVTWISFLPPAAT